MRTKTLRALLAAAVLGGSAVALGVLSTGSASAGVVPIAIPAASRHVFAQSKNFGDTAVDAVHRHVALSEPDDGHLVVLNYDGSVAADKADLPGIDGVRFDAGSTRLYAAVAGAGAVVAFDASTLTEVARYPLGDGVLPETIALAGGRLWFSYHGPGIASQADVGSLDLSDGTVTPAQVVNVDSAAPLLTSTAKLLGVASGREVQVFDVSSGTPVQVADRSLDIVNLRGIAFSADATQLYAGGWGGTQAISIADSSLAGSLPPNGAIQSVDGSAAGLMVANLPSGTLPELYFFPPGATTATKQWDIPQAGLDWTISKVVWEPGGGRVFVIAQEGGGADSMWAIDDPAHRDTVLTTPDLTVSPSGTVYNYGTTVTVTAHLGTTAENRTVEIWADPYGTDQGNRLLRKAAADAKGNVTTTVKLTRNTVLSAVFAGDTGYAARTVKSTVYARVSVTTAVSKQYTTSGGYYYFHRTKNPVFTTTMTVAPMRKQKLYFDVYSGGKWKAWKSYLLTPNSAGKTGFTLGGTHSINIKYRVRAATSGDTLNYLTYGSYRYFTFRK